MACATASEPSAKYPSGSLSVSQPSTHPSEAMSKSRDPRLQRQAEKDGEAREWPDDRGNRSLSAGQSKPPKEEAPEGKKRPAESSSTKDMSDRTGYQEIQDQDARRRLPKVPPTPLPSLKPITKLSGDASKSNNAGQKPNETRSISIIREVSNPILCYLSRDKDGKNCKAIFNGVSNLKVDKLMWLDRSG